MQFKGFVLICSLVFRFSNGLERGNKIVNALLVITHLSPDFCCCTGLSTFIEIIEREMVWLDIQFTVNHVWLGALMFALKNTIK